MTIHKSKGLEFPVVVLADAGKERRALSDQAYLLPEIGLALKLDPPPMLYRLAKWQDGLQNEAESLRILYVALTRAKRKTHHQRAHYSDIKRGMEVSGMDGGYCRWGSGNYKRFGGSGGNTCDIADLLWSSGACSCLS